MAFSCEGTGGTISHAGGKTIHTFSADGTFDISGCGTGDIEYLIVAGGGGGGRSRAGGGGGGGVVSGTDVAFSGSASVAIGAGGTGASTNGAQGGDGGNSTWNSHTATGGGGGGAETTHNGRAGGSGGGAGAASFDPGTPGTGTAGQGHDGGTATSAGSPNLGGGGGAGAAGGNGSGSGGGTGGNGGAGVSNSISGSAVYYAGGGGGGGATTDGTGGTGGGGAAGSPPTAGTDGLGGGGGACWSTDNAGADGGDGIVILSYDTPANPPTLDTNAASSIALETATLNGDITTTGGDTPDERGFVWDTESHSDPGNTAPASSAYADYETETGTFGTGAYTYGATGLDPTTTIYVRAYAHNANGYAYGNEVSFTTKLPAGFEWENVSGSTYDAADTQTIFAEELNDLLRRIEALEGA